ncbi:MAG: TldD/PmbA family protein [Dehalococcoidales bacterium]|nr:TldD/PmbA family protein [Dehalococcoidales bacterium]
MERILARAKKVAEAADVFVVVSEETPVQFEANRLKNIQSKQSTTVALRVVCNGRIGYAAATSLEDGQHLVDMAVAAAQFGMAAKFELPVVRSYPEIDIFDIDTESVSLEAMIKLGEELIGKLRKHTPTLLCNASISKDVMSVRIMNSRGGQASYKMTISGLGVWGNLIRGTDMLFVGDSESSCHPILESDTIAKAVIQRLELASRMATVSTRSLPVVFTPDGVASAIIPSLMAAFNGKLVLEGASPIGSKLGQKVFDKKLQVWDDPTRDYRPTSRPCDDEGVASRRTPLIEEGVVTNFLYDLQTAALAHTRSTGNGSRGRGGLPSPSPSAFVIAPGKVTLDEMISDIKDGLVVDELMGADQGNILGGDFSGNILLGYKVENGKITGRVKDTMVSGNIYQLLKEITAIGSEAKWVGGSLFIPPLYFSGVSVASKGKK